MIYYRYDLRWKDYTVPLEGKITAINEFEKNYDRTFLSKFNEEMYMEFVK